MWTTPFVKNWKNTEKYVLKNSMKYQKMKLSMQGHWPTCEPHHLSTGTRQHWLASHNYSPRWWVSLSFIFCIIIIDLVPLSFIFFVGYISYICHSYWLISNNLSPRRLELFVSHFVIANLRHQNEADLLPITAYNSRDLVKVIPHVPKRLPLG